MPKLMYNYFSFGGIEFGGINESTFIEKVPNQNRPRRKADVYNVPGRNGDIVVMQDAWENVEQAYQIWGGNGSINSATDFGYKVSNLFSLSGYQTLTDSYDPDHFRYAYFLDAFNVESVYTRRGRATIIFSCDPRRFIMDGYSNWREVDTSGHSMGDEVPTPYDSKPQIKVFGSGSGTVTIGGRTITISSITNEMILDCENEQAYKGTTSLNTDVSGQFPIIPGGVHGHPNVYFTGGVSKVQIRPDWWVL